MFVVAEVTLKDSNLIKDDEVVGETKKFNLNDLAKDTTVSQSFVFREVSCVKPCCQ